VFSLEGVMKIWIYSVVLLLPALWTGRCLQGLIAKQPCRGACTATVMTLFMLIMIAPGIWPTDGLSFEFLEFPSDWSFFETTAGTLVMSGGIFAVVAGALFLVARYLR
jgi:hypothetical protein